MVPAAGRDPFWRKAWIEEARQGKAFWMCPDDGHDFWTLEEDGAVLLFARPLLDCWELMGEPRELPSGGPQGRRIATRNWGPESSPFLLGVRECTPQEQLQAQTEGANAMAHFGTLNGSDTLHAGYPDPMEMWTIGSP